MGKENGAATDSRLDHRQTMVGSIRAIFIDFMKAFPMEFRIVFGLDIVYEL